MVRAGEPVQSHGCSLEKSWPRTLGRDSCGDAGGVSTDGLQGAAALSPEFGEIQFCRVNPQGFTWQTGPSGSRQGAGL